MDEFSKERIISEGIIERKDWPRLKPEHMELAKLILTMLDLQKTDPEADILSDLSFKSDEQHAEELAQGIGELNDDVELENVDKVEPEKTFEKGVPMGIPTSLVPFFNNLLQNEN
jgi:hypothetical protein